MCGKTIGQGQVCGKEQLVEKLYQSVDVMMIRLRRIHPRSELLELPRQYRRMARNFAACVFLGRSYRLRAVCYRHLSLLAVCRRFADLCPPEDRTRFCQAVQRLTPDARLAHDAGDSVSACPMHCFFSLFPEKSPRMTGGMTHTI